MASSRSLSFRQQLQRFCRGYLPRQDASTFLQETGLEWQSGETWTDRLGWVGMS